MNKVTLLSLPFFIVMPALSVAAPCVPYDNVVYSLQADGATGTLTKSQACTGDANSGAYAITSQIDVKKAIFSRQVTQNATGTYTSPNTIGAQSFTTTSDKDASLPSGTLDTLSLVLYLSDTLDAKTPSFMPIPLFYNGKTISVQCAIKDLNTTITSNSGQNITVTNITCAAVDNSTVLNYSFGRDRLHMLLAATVIEGDETKMTMRIN